MPYNNKQYDAALDFMPAADANIPNVWDAKRVSAYDLYENLYINSTVSLQIALRGVDQVPILMPSGKKIIEATNRFLGVGLDYLVDDGGDGGARDETDQWWSDFFKREAIPSKFASNKRWGLVRGDAAFYISAKPHKVAGSRICCTELDPRFLFEIEDPNDADNLLGVHIVEPVQDFRDPDKPDKQIAKRRTFRRLYDIDGSATGVTSELTFWEIGKWDDRDPTNKAKMEQVTGSGVDEEEFLLPATITQLPVYKWRNSPPQNSSWGHSQVTGLETLLYAINQSLSDEDATIVFQGLGMYVTNAGPPRDPSTNEVTDWNIGPKQIIEIGQDQMFQRVTGVTDVSAMQDHINYMDEKGLSEASGTPEIAIGRVDVTVAESGIALQLQMAPLIAGNAEKELEMINILDQMFHDITAMWLPGYEPEQFGNVDVMTQINVVCIFDDPMPKNRDADVQETVLLDSSNLILKSMVVAKLRSLGWQYPTVDDNGNPYTDDDIAAMLLSQTAAASAALDPFGAGAAGAAGQEGATADDEFSGTDSGNTPDEQTISLGNT